MNKTLVVLPEIPAGSPRPPVPVAGTSKKAVAAEEALDNHLYATVPPSGTVKAFATNLTLANATFAIAPKPPADPAPEFFGSNEKCILNLCISLG